MIVIVLFYKDVEQMEMAVKAEFSLGPFSVVLCHATFSILALCPGHGTG